MKQLFNVGNRAAIENLIERHVIIFEGQTIQLFNKSFNNFVLTKINANYIKRLKKEVEKKGAWSSISSVLIIILLALAGFVFIGNPGLSESFTAIVTVLAGVLGLLPRFLPMLSSQAAATDVSAG